MNLLEVLMLGALAGASACGGAAAYFIQRRIMSSGELIYRGGQRLAELCRQQDSLRRLAAAQVLAESTIEGGTRIVQGVHQGIAAIPFSILEAIPVTRDTTQVVRKTHDLIAGGVYGGISIVNRLVGGVLRGGLSGEKENPSAGKKSPP